MTARQTSTTWTYVSRTDLDLAVGADCADLRRVYERELREDGKYDLPDDQLVAWVYEQNPDAPELEIEE